MNILNFEHTRDDSQLKDRLSSSEDSNKKHCLLVVGIELLDRRVMGSRGQLDF